ncbi:hypothetical protein GCM10027515_24350 [Schumannella luteola]|uniref:Uncharacterized protein n=1 Tax=Schumannella luteola TaxID=472059 RepID=A0A852YIM0_9MICO|nr:hypothetical protein [Schumannella luteola]NYG99767.1 hypothetical protein [Schumannella luteola]TPX06543.1 hypothetical protein FJ656_00920 [Schumannella luteola]
MTFLPIPADAELTAAARVAALRRLPDGATATPSERALLGHLPSFDAYTQWYALRDELVPYIGERALALFGYAITDALDSLHGTAWFRRQLVEGGGDPDSAEVTETERVLLDWGRRIGADANGIPDEVADLIQAKFSPGLRLMLVAFAGQTVAAAVFAAVGRVPLAEPLLEFRRPGDLRTS